jgi:hypothetical protein
LIRHFIAFYTLVAKEDNAVHEDILTDVHGPPAVEVPEWSGQAVGEGAGAYFAEAVYFRQIFYFNYCIAHFFIH